MQKLCDKDYRNAIQDAYEKLSQKDKIQIDFVVNSLIARIKARNRKTVFGKLQALELVALSGIWINENGIKG